MAHELTLYIFLPRNRTYVLKGGDYYVILAKKTLTYERRLFYERRSSQAWEHVVLLL